MQTTSVVMQLTKHGGFGLQRLNNNSTASRVKDNFMNILGSGFFFDDISRKYL